MSVESQYKFSAGSCTNCYICKTLIHYHNAYIIANLYTLNAILIMFPSYVLTGNEMTAGDVLGTINNIPIHTKCKVILCDPLVHSVLL